VQEDVDAVGISILSGAHLTLFPAIIAELRKRGAAEVVVFGGGIIPEEDMPTLTEAGVAKVFTPGSTTVEIGEWVRQNIRPRS
jgi:methylmalonyl-CoA mutase C-terminal domain/subunit